MQNFSRRGVFLLCIALAAGCGSNRSSERYVPPPASARQALEAALRSWQQGRPTGTVEGTANPTVILVDNCRDRAQTLESFTILGEVPGEGPRCFAVRLRLENPKEEQRVRFVVFGVDPLWVYRHEDFEMMIHWQCGLAEREAAAKGESEKTDVRP